MVRIGATQSEDEMEKYGVGIEEQDDGKVAATHDRCPRCGSNLDKDSAVPKCPKCGTEPFEKDE